MSSASSVSRAEFLAIKMPAPRPVEIPGLGTIHVRALSGRERERWEAIASKDSNNVRASMVAFTACDADGNRLFRLDDVEALNDLPYGALYAIHEAALEINKIGKDQMEEIEKNSSTTPSDSTPSESP